MAHQKSTTVAVNLTPLQLSTLMDIVGDEVNAQRRTLKKATAPREIAYGRAKIDFLRQLDSVLTQSASAATRADVIQDTLQAAIEAKMALDPALTLDELSIRNR